MADASNFTWPKFGINELEVSSCTRPEANATASNELFYAASYTPRVTDVNPRRGSTAGDPPTISQFHNFAISHNFTISQFHNFKIGQNQGPRTATLRARSTISQLHNFKIRAQL